MVGLDETWASAYFQAAIAILVFGIGIPALVLQVIVPDDVRKIAYRRSAWIRRLWVLVIGFSAVALLFVWLLHPAASSATRLLAFVGPEWDGPIAAVAMSVAIVGLSVVLWLYTLHLRGRVLQSLSNDCAKSIRRRGVVDEAALSDIRYLGEHADTRGERADVLNILENLSKSVKDKDDYSGDGLEGLIRAVECCLRTSDDQDILGDGIAVLTNIAEYKRTAENRGASDNANVVRTLQRLMRQAVSADTDRPTERILKALDFVGRGPRGLYAETERALMDLGILALQREKYPTATAAFSKLEADAADHQPLKAGRGRAYLGLLAHFWKQGGAARTKALASLQKMDLYPSTSECLAEAEGLHYRASRLATADAIGGLRGSIDRGDKSVLQAVAQDAGDSSVPAPAKGKKNGRKPNSSASPRASEDWSSRASNPTGEAVAGVFRRSGGNEPDADASDI